MRTQMAWKLILGVPVLAAAALAHSPGPRVGFAGVPADGGQTCAACHFTYAPPNSDETGKVELQAEAYEPGKPQVLRIVLSHPEAARWGFQITARRIDDEALGAGTFAESEDVQVKCADRAPLPCGDQPEFASHRLLSTRPGMTGESVWEVTWTPPADTEGAYVFYIAANAANDDGRPYNDRIYTARVEVARRQEPKPEEPPMPEPPTTPEPPQD